MTLEIHDNELGWLSAATAEFLPNRALRLEYDLDYASDYWGRRDRFALSLTLPVDAEVHHLEMPGFLLDLMPQGEPLRRLLRRYGLLRDDQHAEVLSLIPLASPGNLRVKEPWDSIELLRESYHHPGFPSKDIVKYKREFVEYMEHHGAPIGGTSGAGGGSPKFLLRRDQHGQFHADGMLDDRLTDAAYLIKFPYTDSRNSVELLHVEKIYYDALRTLPLITGQPMELIDDALFIRRFDRERDAKGRLCYHGLESFYSAHNISTAGAFLSHEDNLRLIERCSSEPVSDILEYIKRDLINTALSNSDNHGRNSSFIKRGQDVRLSPLYDVTAMQLFEGDLIVELTRWKSEHLDIGKRMRWIEKSFVEVASRLGSELATFLSAISDLEGLLRSCGASEPFLTKTRPQRDALLQTLDTAINESATA